MSEVAVTAPNKQSLFRLLVPSVVSGIVLGVAGAVVAGLVVNAVTYSSDTQSSNQDAVLSAIYIAWVLFFFVGIGGFNGIVKWGFASHEPTHEEDEEIAGKGQGLWRYFRFTTDHKVVGLQYLFTVLVIFFVGGLGAFMIRLEQSQPGAIFFSPSTYNTIVGMHGIVMIVATILMISGPFGNFILPIMIGARDMAFPRLNALSYWLIFVDVPVILSTLVLGGFPTGWTGYSPLGNQAGLGQIAYCFFIIIFAVSLAVAGLNILTTVFILRTKGMTWGRLPIFVWGTCLAVFLGMIAFPAFLSAQIMVVMDRVFQTSFYVAALGGSNWVYEHVFWFMGHPEVYVILLPSLAAVAEITSVFSRKPVFGYRLLLGGFIGISVLSVLVWGHHLYTSGSQSPLDGPFMLDTELISIPTGVIFLVLVGTLWRGKIWPSVPLLFVLAVLVNFVIGGVTGVYLADIPTDEILHGGIFVTAHFHFTLVGTATVGFFSAFYYWFPKMTGRRLDPLLGKLHFWLFEIGFVGTFLSLFYAGLQGEARWLAFIPPSLAVPNLIASSFAVLIAASVFVLIYNVVITMARGERAEANEWGANTLEWQVPTPVPLENFVGELPVVAALPYDYSIQEEAGAVVTEETSVQTQTD